jgi:hypothetical protein
MRNGQRERKTERGGERDRETERYLEKNRQRTHRNKETKKQRAERWIKKKTSRIIEM